MATETRLHYIYDPLCGWCYAVAPLVKAAQTVIPITLHGGGMMTGARRQKITPEWKTYVGPHDRQITQVTGQAFGEQYLNGLLNDYGAWLDSEPPTTAVLAAEQVGAAGLDMLARLYEAHYVEGRRIADDRVLHELARDINLDVAAFSSALAALSGALVRTHFAESRDMLSRAGGRGFPTFILEREGTLERLDHTPYLGRPEAWQAALRGVARLPRHRQSTWKLAADQTVAPSSNLSYENERAYMKEFCLSLPGRVGILGTQGRTSRRRKLRLTQRRLQTSGPIHPI